MDISLKLLLFLFNVMPSLIPCISYEPRNHEGFLPLSLLLHLVTCHEDASIFYPFPWKLLFCDCSHVLLALEVSITTSSFVSVFTYFIVFCSAVSPLKKKAFFRQNFSLCFLVSTDSRTIGECKNSGSHFRIALEMNHHKKKKKKNKQKKRLHRSQTVKCIRYWVARLV